MASSSLIPSVIVIVTILILLAPELRAATLPLHPRDVLPFLPRQVSWPILNSLHSAVDLLPTFVRAVSSHNDSPERKGACFYENTTWMEFHNNSGSQFGDGTLHIKGLGLSDILVEVEKRGSSFDELLTIPEQDDWIYTDGKSTSRVAFVLEMYKEAGLFASIATSIEVTEFTIKDACMLNFFENSSSRLPDWCGSEDDVKLPFCQIRGKYRMELPGYNTMEPYPHMNERSLPCLLNTPGNRIANSSVSSP